MDGDQYCRKCLNVEICLPFQDDSPFMNCPWFRDWKDILK